MVKIIAHRGFSSQYPENTLCSFQGAIDSGADLIELDLQITADKELVIFHDTELARTTNGVGIVESLSLAELRSYDAGSWFSPKFQGERIPTLMEVFKLCENKIGINIEIKPTKVLDIIPAFEEALKENVSSLEVFVSSFDIHLLVELMERNPGLACAYAFLDNELLEKIETREPGVVLDHEVVRLSSFEHIERAASLGFRDINFRWSILTHELVNYAHEKGLLVNCWTVDEKEDMVSLITMGVDGIITNYPNRLREVLVKVG